MAVYCKDCVHSGKSTDEYPCSECGLWHEYEMYPMYEKADRDGESAKELKKQKRNWGNAFQRWSDKVSQEWTTPLGCCGYGTICDCCTDNHIGRPCVRALNRKARSKNIRIDYADWDFEKYFYL